MTVRECVDGVITLVVGVSILVTIASGAYASLRWATGPACCSTACPCTEAAKCSR